MLTQNYVNLWNYCVSNGQSVFGNSNTTTITPANEGSNDMTFISNASSRNNYSSAINNIWGVII